MARSRIANAFQLIVVIVCLLVASAGLGQNNAGDPPGKPAWVSTVSHKPGVHDISAPLRSIRPANDRFVIQRLYGPLAGEHVEEEALDPQPFTGSTAKIANPSPSGMTMAGAPTWLNGISYQGQGSTMGGYVITGEPPDTEGAIGKDHFVQVVNSSIAVFDKTGNLLYGPVDIKNLFQGFPSTDGNRCAKNNDGDPIIYYDQLADRWFISQFDVTRPAGATSDYQCLAVSVSGDPLGSYYRWDYPIPDGMMGDYEKVGLWPDGYYMTIRAFDTAGSFQGAKVLVFDRSKLLVGAPDATQLDSGYLCSGGISNTPPCPTSKGRFTGVDGFTPMSLDGFVPPPPSMPGAAAAYYRTISGGFYSGWFVRLYWLKVNSLSDGSWPALPALTVSSPQDITVNQFSAPASVPQPGTTQTLDTLANNMMYRLAYRNFGTPSAPDDRLVVNHTVTDTVTSGSGASAGIRWYQFGNGSASNPKVPLGTGANLTPTLVTQQTFSPDATARWMGSIAMDKRGNIGIGYSITSSTTTKPGIAITGKQPGDASLQPETVVQAGGGIKPSTNPDGSAGNNRWGDYSQTSIDPIDDCTFWHTNEYIPSDGNFNWATAFAAFKFPDCVSCTAPPTPTGVSGTANSATSFTLTWAASTGAASYKIYRSLAPAPQGTPTFLASTASLTFTDNSLVSGTTYYYSVTAVSANGNCESIRSTSVSSASGSCVANPSFEGVKTVDPYVITTGGTIVNSSCSVHLTWRAGTSNCPLSNDVTYNVYRSTTSTFVPSASNRIASCVGSTSYDDPSPSGAGPFYYIVHAEDASSGNGGPCNGGTEDKNTVRLSATPGNFASLYYNNFDAVAVGSYPAGWTGAGQWRGAAQCNPAYSGLNVLHWGGAACGDQYAISANDDLTSPTINIPAGASQARFSMWHRWNMAGTVRDGLHLRVSVNGAAPIEVPSAAFLGGGYTGTRLSDNGDGCGNTLPYKDLGIWGGQQSTFVNTVVDLDQVCGGGTCAGKTVRFYFTGLSNCTATNDLGWFIDEVQVLTSTGSCGTAPASAQLLTATSASAQNTLQWVIGASGSRLRIVYRTDSFPTGPSDGTPVPGSPVAVSPNQAGSTIHNGLQNGQTYYYAAYVDTGAGTQTSGANYVSGRPFASGGPTQWIYNTGAASLTPPGVGSSSAYTVSNDRLVHSIANGNGLWPTSPGTWRPFAMNAPSQARPGVPTVNFSGTLKEVVYVGSQDGNVYCINSATGAQEWKTASALAPAGSLVQGAVNGVFTTYGSTFNRVFAGTRNSTANNVMYGLNATTGGTDWSFNNGGGVNAIGIITGDPWVEYGTQKLYFTSRSKVGGSSGTLWCVTFDGVSCSGFPVSLGDIDGSVTLFNNRIYVGNNSGRVYVVDATTGATYGSFDTNDGPVKGFVSVNFFTGSAPYDVYFATTSKVWRVSDNGLTSNALSSTWNVPVAGASVPLFDGSSILVGSSDGKLYRLSLSNGATLASAVLGDGTAAVGSPSFDYAHQKYYVGTDGGQVYSVQAPLQ